MKVTIKELAELLGMKTPLPNQVWMASQSVKK